MLFYSCQSRNNENRTTNKSIKELLTKIIEKNNYTLGKYRDANKFLLKVDKKNELNYWSNLEKIDSLIKINNETYTNSNKLIQLIKEHNSNSKDRNEILIESDFIDNETNYYLYLSKLIDNSSFVTGSLNEPKHLLPFAINNNKFFGAYGDTIQIPIKTFVEKDLIHWRYELFDTLNFKSINKTEGYFEIAIDKYDTDKYRKRCKIFGKNIYTGESKIIGKPEIEIHIIKK